MNKTYIADFNKKELVEKVSMVNPSEYTEYVKWVDCGCVDCLKHRDEYDMQYVAHLEFLTRYPAPWLCPDQHGKEFELGKDFEVKKRYMDIYSREGTKVTPVYIGGIPSNGSSYDKEKVSKYLKEGEWYTVESTEVHNCSSTVELKEVPGVSFNTVNFYGEPAALPIAQPPKEDRGEDAKDKEIERLKGLIENALIYGWRGFNIPLSELINDFKTENNL